MHFFCKMISGSRDSNIATGNCVPWVRKDDGWRKLASGESNNLINNVPNIMGGEPRAECHSCAKALRQGTMWKVRMSCGTCGGTAVCP